MQAEEAAAHRLPDLRHVRRSPRPRGLSTTSATATGAGDAAVRVAVDVLGHDGEPESVLAGVLAAVAADPALSVVLVGPQHALDPVVAEQPRQIAGRLSVADAAEVVGMAEHPVRAVRTRPASTVRVAADLVHDGRADVMLSVGSTGAALSAAVHVLGRTPGMERPALVVTIPGPTGELTLLDVGATLDPTPEQLLAHGRAGLAYATARYGPGRRLGLLTVGAESGKGDALRREVAPLLAAQVPAYAGQVEGHDVPGGELVDVVLTDGFTGNVLLKGLEGTVAMLARTLAADPALAGPVTERLSHLRPERTSGAVVLGVEGTVIVGHGASSSGAVTCCVQLAADTVRTAVLKGVRAAVSDGTTRLGP